MRSDDLTPREVLLMIVVMLFCVGMCAVFSLLTNASGRWIW